MNLNLEYPPAPEFAEKHAAAIVQAMKEMEGKNLDYSLESIADLDRLLANFHAQGVGPERIPSVLFRIGCYVGEVLIRAHRAAWVDAARFMPLEEAGMFSFMVLRFSDGTIWDPIGKAFAVLVNPAADSLQFSARAQAQQQSPAKA